MANFALAFKQEIQRIARKEARAETAPLKTALTAAKARIRSLSEQVTKLDKQLARARRERPAAGAPAGEESEEASLRFRPEGFAAHRKRLGLSAAQVAKLLDVSSLSVYKWESGKTRPRAAQLQKIAMLRKMGKREAEAKLAA